MKKPVLKSHILYASNYVAFWKRQNYSDNKRLVVARDLAGRRGWLVESRENFQDGETILRDIIADTGHYASVKTYSIL